MRGSICRWENAGWEAFGWICEGVGWLMSFWVFGFCLFGGREWVFFSLWVLGNSLFGSGITWTVLEMVRGVWWGGEMMKMFLLEDFVVCDGVKIWK